MYQKIILFILLPFFGFSQAPQKINFQSILRNNNGEIVSNKSVSLKISILSGSIGGSSVYSEIHTKTTDISGLISLQIGNGTVLSGVFANIGWGNAPHFIKLEVDFSGGSNFVLLGTQELMSVPYALYASKTDTSSLNLTNRLGEKVNISDTASMLTNYRTGLNSKVNIADTANMLNPYLRKASNQNSTLELFGIHSWEYPEGFSKEFVIISVDNLPYTVPSGKNLYMFPQNSFPFINGYIYGGGGGGGGIILTEGNTISSFGGASGYNPGFTETMGFGFLVSKTNKITPINLPLNQTNLTYTVPLNKILVIKSGGGGTFCIGTKSLRNEGILIIPEGITIKICYNEEGFTGYLLDK